MHTPGAVVRIGRSVTPAMLWDDSWPELPVTRRILSLATLEVGTVVTVLSESTVSDIGYALVITPPGLVGWVNIRCLHRER